MRPIWNEALNLMENEEVRGDIRQVLSEEVDLQYKRVMGRVSGHLKGSGGMFGLDSGVDLKAITKNPLLAILYFMGGKGLNASPSNANSGEFEIGKT